MTSNQNRIKDVLHQLQLDLNGPEVPSIVNCTLKEYKRMNVYDPQCIYVCQCEDGSCQYYFGSNYLDSSNSTKSYPKYFLALDEQNKYGIYKMALNSLTGIIEPTWLYSFDDAQSAINALHKYAWIRNQDDDSLKIYNTLSTYIQKECGLHEAIMQILAGSGYREDMQFQWLNQESISYGIHMGDRRLNQQFINDRMFSVGCHLPSLYQMYYDIYKVIESYGFFEDKKYTEADPDDIDLNGPIEQILEIVKN